MDQIEVPKIAECIIQDRPLECTQRSLEGIVSNAAREVVESIRTIKKLKNKVGLDMKEIIDFGHEYIYLPLLFYFSKKAERCRKKHKQAYAIGCIVGYSQAIHLLCRMNIPKIRRMAKIQLDKVLDAFMFSAFFKHIDEMEGASIRDIYDEQDEQLFPYAIFNNTLNYMEGIEEKEKIRLLKACCGFWVKVTHPSKRYSMDKQTLADVIKMVFYYSGKNRLSTKLLGRYGLKAQTTSKLTLIQVAVQITCNPYKIMRKQRKINEDATRKMIEMVMKENIGKTGRIPTSVSELIRTCGLPISWKSYKPAKKILKKVLSDILSTASY